MSNRSLEHTPGTPKIQIFVGMFQGYVLVFVDTCNRSHQKYQFSGNQTMQMCGWFWRVSLRTMHWLGLVFPKILAPKTLSGPTDRHGPPLPSSTHREAQFQVTDFFDNFSVPVELKDEVTELLGGNQRVRAGRNGWFVCFKEFPLETGEIFEHEGEERFFLKVCGKVDR